MERIGRDILIVFVVIIALVIAWELFKLLFWVMLWAVAIVLVYRGIKWLYYTLTGKTPSSTYQDF